MKMNFAKHAANQNLIAADLERQLKALAPAPAKAAKTAPATKEAPAAPNRDGLLGGMLFDCLFGLPLTDLLGETAEQMTMTENPALSCGTAIDMYDEIRRDRAKENRTNGKIELGVQGSVNGLFNRVGNGQLTDTPQRLNLEAHYAMIARMKRPPGFYMAA